MVRESTAERLRDRVTPTAGGALTYTLTCTGAAATGGGGAYGGGGGSAPTATQTATLTVTAATPPPPTAYVVKPLVADGAGVASNQDLNLVNPWGLVFAPNDAVWIANNGKDTSTLYDGNGAAQPTNQPLIVTLPAKLANGASVKSADRNRRVQLLDTVPQRLQSHLGR